MHSNLLLKPGIQSTKKQRVSLLLYHAWDLVPQCTESLNISQDTTSLPQLDNLPPRGAHLSHGFKDRYRLLMECCP